MSGTHLVRKGPRRCRVQAVGDQLVEPHPMKGVGDEMVQLDRVVKGGARGEGAVSQKEK